VKCDNSQNNPLEDPVQLLSEDLATFTRCTAGAASSQASNIQAAEVCKPCGTVFPSSFELACAAALVEHTSEFERVASVRA